MSMNLRDMNYIIILSEEKNIAAAARRLNKHPSSLKRCVEKVEEELDIALFYKTKTGLKLTAEGRTYVEAAKDIIVLEKELFVAR